MKTEPEKSFFQSLVNIFSNKDLPQLVEEVLKGDYDDFRKYLRNNRITSILLAPRQKRSQCLPPLAFDGVLTLHVPLQKDNILHTFQSLQDVGITSFSLLNVSNVTPELINHIFNYVNRDLKELYFETYDDSMSEIMALLMEKAKNSSVEALQFKSSLSESAITILANNLKDLNIRSLTLVGCDLNDTTLNILGSHLGTKITHLDISCNKITDKGINVLLTQPNSLRTVYFGNNKISKEKSAMFNRFLNPNRDNMVNNSSGLMSISNAVTYLFKTNIPKDKAQVLETNSLLRKPKFD